MTARQQEALDFIRANQRIVTVGPSHRELAEHLGIAANAAQQKVNALRGAGYLAAADGRGLVLKSVPAEPHPEEPRVEKRVERSAIPKPVREPIYRPSGRL